MSNDSTHIETYVIGESGLGPIVTLRIHCVPRSVHNDLCNSRTESFGATCNTGLRVYDGSTVLAEFLNRHQSRAALRSASVIELGCGCGLAGMLAAQSASRVVFTDSQKTCLELVGRSVADNLGIEVNVDPRVATETFSWDDQGATEPTGHARYDLVIAAELAYFFVDFRSLLNAIEKLLAPSGVALMCHVNRVTNGSSKISEAAAACGLRMASVSRNAVPRDQRVDFLVLTKGDVNQELLKGLEWEEHQPAALEDDPFSTLAVE